MALELIIQKLIAGSIIIDVYAFVRMTAGAKRKYY